ncbi:MAG: beta-Ala-His dipeptidase [Promethearchaeota archaeon]
MVLENLKPKLVWEIFEQVLIKTPRESKHESKIRKTIIEWVSARAKIENIDVKIKTDDTGNILLKVPATPGMESSPAVLMQGHMDMVCETNRPSGFDFDNLPIDVLIEDNLEWITADGTTLGGDDGIGVALALALIFEKDPTLKHGPLEILFTVDEETGLTGAFGLDVEKLGITSKYLVNIDSEDLGVITIGSAGGGGLKYKKNFTRETDHLSDYEFFNLHVSGLLGGHSGVDIHLPRGNANKICARLLSALNVEGDLGIVLSDWHGGSKHNAITREAKLQFGILKNKVEQAEKILKVEMDSIISYYKPFEAGIEILWKNTSVKSYVSPQISRSIINLLDIHPNGAIRFSPSVPGLVETSCNMAVVNMNPSDFSVDVSCRSNIDAELEALRRSMVQLGKSCGWKVEKEDAYPGWKPEPKSPFLKFVNKYYTDVMGKEIKIEAIHAGLECGIIGAKIPGMQMISIGPDVHNPHTPDERLNIKSVGVLYNVLKKILLNFSELN